MDAISWATLLAPLLPTLILVAGGQHILSRHELRKRSRELELELVRAIREQQYQAVTSVYEYFGRLMALYRDVNGSSSYPNDEQERRAFLGRAIEIEASVDALIVRIACEFATEDDTKLETMLGHMRQATQKWRETIRTGEKLPFSFSHQYDFARFKETYAGVATFIAGRIHRTLAPPTMREEGAMRLIAGAFSNKYEFLKYTPTQDWNQWESDLHHALAGASQRE